MIKNGPGPLSARNLPSLRTTARSHWFAAMDSNRDGEISRREFLGTQDQFQQLDRDADGFIGPAEAASAASI